MPSPDFSQVYLPQSEIVDWMATLGRTTPLDRKNIHQKIYDCRQRGELGKATMIKGTPHLHVKTFFEWACLKKGWEALKTIPDLPAINAKVGVTGVAGTGEVGKVYEASDKDARIKDLEAKIKQLEEWKQKCVARSKRASEAGKLGGRPKTSSR